MNSAARDAALQPERTAMAWNRTGASVVINGILLLRGGIVSGQRLVAVLGGLLLIFGILACGYGSIRHGQLDASADQVVNPHAVLTMTAACAGACLVAIVAIASQLA
jgi:uncharacterized membrane protein YidH (DUF202 family)